jgi:hypothetical protein
MVACSRRRSSLAMLVVLNAVRRAGRSVIAG